MPIYEYRCTKCETEFEELNQPVKLRPQEVQMAQALIESLSGDWNPEEFTDEYRAAPMQVIDAKASGEEIVVAEPEEEAKVVDLMEALKASVEAAKKPSKAAASKTTARSSSKSTSKSASKSSKKTTAKRTTAKTAARKAG